MIFSRLPPIVSAACLLAWSMALPAADPVDQLAERFHLQFQKLLVEEEIPGAAYALVHRGRLLRVGTHGYADTAERRPVDVNTVFRIASVSKGFAGALGALMAAEGLFSMDDPVVHHVPDFSFRGRPETVTVTDILGQRTGFIPNAYDNLIEAGLTREQIFAHFENLEPVCAPGTCYTYQNGAFSLIELVVEQAGGKPYPELVEERLFKPLGMTSASIGYEAFRSASNQALPHVRTQSRWRPITVRSTYYQVSSAAGVNASVLDMAQWTLAMLGHRPDVLPEGVIQHITTPGMRTLRDLNRRYWRQHLSDAHYGLGWRIYDMHGHELVYHGGWVAGFRAEVALSRAHDLGLVILLNAESNVITELTRDFWSEAFELLGWEPAGAATLSPAP